MKTYFELNNEIVNDINNANRWINDYNFSRNDYIAKCNNQNEFLKTIDNEIFVGENEYYGSIMMMQRAFSSCRKINVDLDYDANFYNKPIAARLICDNNQTKMTDGDFKRMLISYKPSKRVQDTLIDWEIEDEYTTPAQINMRKEFFELYNYVRKYVDDYYRKISNGHTAEEEISYKIDRNSKVKNLKMYLNAFVGANENDILLVCEKGFFTIEVKNHNTIMEWDENENFSEYIINGNDKRLLNDFRDPYEQTITHQKECDRYIYKDLGFEGAKAKGVVLLANNDANIIIDSEEIAQRVFKDADSFLCYLDSLENVLNDDEIEKICKTIEKYKVEKNIAFLFPDLYKIDEYFCKLIDYYWLGKELNPVNKYLKFCYERYGRPQRIRNKFEREFKYYTDTLEGLKNLTTKYHDKYNDSGNLPWIEIVIAEAIGLVGSGLLFILPFFAGFKYVILWALIPFIIKLYKKNKDNYKKQKEIFMKNKESIDKQYESSIKEYTRVIVNKEI